MEGETLLDYASCINLYKKRGLYKFTWLKHAESRVERASMVAEILECETHALRRASIQVDPHNYRRLEDYAKAIGVVEYNSLEKRYVGYGKLMQVTVYLGYESKKYPSLSRRFEVTMHIPIPLHVVEYETLDDKMEELARYALEEIGFASELAYSSMLDKIGYEFIYSREYVEGLTWCNRVVKARLDDDINVEVVSMKTIPPFRSWYYTYRISGGWCYVRSMGL